ncbi:MAG: ferrous iron transporter B, partial [Spirochaetaceae bacterium]|nr:ferrous iron transporter B [Spirochaetaceae bacterium]
MEENSLRIALAGNPNSGKTTLFNALTGAHHHVGNYPGVTVEKREGKRTRNGRVYDFTDLPGIYSLTAYSEDEVVSRDFILDEKPDLIIDVLDSTNLERNLYLCLQLRELGIPVVGALNMSDEAKARGIRIDEARLSATFGIKFVKITAVKGHGINDLLDKVDSAYAEAQNTTGCTGAEVLSYGADIEPWLEKIEALITRRENSRGEGAEDIRVKAEARFLAAKLLEKDKAAETRLAGGANGGEILSAAREGIEWIEKHCGKDAEIVLSERRYARIHEALKGAVHVDKAAKVSIAETFDRVVMNRFLALPIFIGILWIVFQLTFTIGAYPQDWLQS